jgi:hypothetical protein
MDINHKRKEAKEIWAELGRLINKEFNIPGWMDGETIQKIINSDDIIEIEGFIKYTTDLITLIKESG